MQWKTAQQSVRTTDAWARKCDERENVSESVCLPVYVPLCVSLSVYGVCVCLCVWYLCVVCMSGCVCDFMCLCVCVICLCMCLHVCVFLFLSLCLFLCVVCVSVCLCVCCLFVCVCLCVCLCVCVPMRACARISERKSENQHRGRTFAEKERQGGTEPGTNGKLFGLVLNRLAELTHCSSFTNHGILLASSAWWQHSHLDLASLD